MNKNKIFYGIIKTDGGIGVSEVDNSPLLYENKKDAQDIIDLRKKYKHKWFTPKDRFGSPIGSTICWNYQ